MWLRFARRMLARSAASGVVVVEGTVKEGLKTLSIPGSHVRPVFYDMVFESYRAVPGGRGRFAWMVDRSDVQIVPFVLEDEAGRMWINGERDHVLVRGGGGGRGTAGQKAGGGERARRSRPAGEG